MAQVSERVWRTPARNYVRLLPGCLGVSHRGYSRRLERVLCEFGSEQSFERAAESVREHYGFVLGASALRKATLKHAQRARQELQRKYQEPFRALPSQGQEYVIGEADGTLICTVAPGKRKAKRPRSWQEMRLVAAQAKDSARAVYAAGFTEVEETGRRWGHCVRDAGWGLQSQIHTLGDGAEWIRLQSQEVFGVQGRFLCDFYHVSEYLAEAAQVCAGDRAQSWRRTQQKRLRRGALELVIESLEPHLEAEDWPEEQTPVRNGHRYLSNRKDCLDYPRAIAQGLPIGSGMIESGHRHVLQARLKKAGTAWLVETADQMAHLRVIKANRQWSTFWN